MEVLTAPEPVAGSRRERGMSLVEVLAALLILALVVVSVMTMFSHSMRLNATGADYTSLTNMAKDKAEELLSLPYTHPDLDQAPTTQHGETLDDPDQRLHVVIGWQVAEHHIRQGADSPAAVFKGNPRVSSVPAAQANTGNIKVITVTVTATSAAGIGDRSVTVQGIKVVE